MRIILASGVAQGSGVREDIGRVESALCALVREVQGMRGELIALSDHPTLSHATAAHTVEHSVRAAADLERENVALERQLEEQSARRTRAERELRQLTNNRIALEQVRTSL